MKVTVLSLPPIFTNCYIVSVKDRGECIIIDPASSSREIIEAVEESGLTPKAVFLTHGHFDHIGAAEELREHYSIPVFIHEGDAEMILSPLLNCSLSMMGDPVSLSPADRLMKDGDTIDIDGELLTLMNTPGHSEGSSVLVGGDAVFSGDTVFLNSYGRYDLPGGDLEKLKSSIIKILSLDRSLKIYPGHGGTTSVADERRFYGI